MTTRLAEHDAAAGVLHCRIRVTASLGVLLKQILSIVSPFEQRPPRDDPRGATRFPEIKTFALAADEPAYYSLGVILPDRFSHPKSRPDKTLPYPPSKPR